MLEAIRAISEMKDQNRIRRRRFLKGTVAVSALGLGAQSVYAGDEGQGGENASENGTTAGTVEDSSQLEITDVRVAMLEDIPFPSPIVKVYTNQDITGLGEARDHSDPRHILMLKSILLGRNPLNIEQIFRDIRRYGSHARAGGGVSALDTALYDIAGKFYDIPAHQLIGGQYREKVRMYTDTTESEDPEEYAERLNEKVEEDGFTALKMDLGIGLISDEEGTLNNTEVWENEDGELPGQYGYGTDPVTGPTYGSAEHEFTQIRITEKGLDAMEEYVATVRDVVGYEISLGVDHFGHFPVKEHIQLAERFKKYDLAYMENIAPWFNTDKLKQFTENTTVPSMVGEDIFGLDPAHLRGQGETGQGFKALIDQQAVDLIHPDLATAGGITETKRIADYAHDRAVPMYLHFAGSPIGAMASVHVAAASRNFQALENHSSEIDVWEDLATLVGTDDPMVESGFYNVPEGPGLGIELNEDLAQEYANDEWGWFEPTDEWDDVAARQFWE